nr:Chain C, 10-mer peptide [synthetic construct]
RVAQLEQVYI